VTVVADETNVLGWPPHSLSTPNPPTDLAISVRILTADNTTETSRYRALAVEVFRLEAIERQRRQ
jgi:hypothetical protein